MIKLSKHLLATSWLCVYFAIKIAIIFRLIFPIRSKDPIFTFIFGRIDINILCLNSLFYRWFARTFVKVVPLLYSKVHPLLWPQTARNVQNPPVLNPNHRRTRRHHSLSGMNKNKASNWFRKFAESIWSLDHHNLFSTKQISPWDKHPAWQVFSSEW